MTRDHPGDETNDTLRKWLEALDDDHLSFDEMSRYADGLCPDDERSAIALHMEGCRMCREEGADLVAEAAMRTSVGLRGKGAEGPNVTGAARRWRAALMRETEDLPTGRRSAVLYLAAGLAAVAALIVAISFRRTPPNPVRPPALVASAGTRSMAILPLRNVSGSAADAFLSVGLADALITRMDANPSLSIRSMPSTQRIQRESADRRTAARRLKVDMVLEGEFVAVDGLVRVTLQLTEARSGHRLWAEAIEGRRDDLLGLVDRLTERTESRLHDGRRTATVRGGNGSEPRSTNAQAYESYMRARSISGSLVRANYVSQVRALRRAIELDPNFAAAHAELSIALELGGLVRGLAREGDLLSESERHARLAVALDPRLPEAHLALGRALSTRPDRFPEAMREVVAAIELQSTSLHALQIVTSYFAMAGDLERAQCVSDRIIRLDPFSNEARTLGYWSIEAADPNEALRKAEHALADPDTALAGHDIRGLAFILQGNLLDADREADAALRLFPNHYIGKSLKAMVAAARADRAGAESWLAKFEEDANRNHFSAIRVALCRAKLGDREAALDWIERATNLGHSRWHSLTRHPWLAQLRSAPRFQACLARMKRNLDDSRGDVMRVYPLICSSPDPEQGNVVAGMRGASTPRDPSKIAFAPSFHLE